MASTLATLAALAAMAALPGRTSSHYRISVDEVAAAPSAGGFHIDGLRFDLDAYGRDTHLDPLRRFMAESCPGRRGLDGAICVSDEFARQFPFGRPGQEFLNPSYDPATDLEAHLSGEPGHCVTRSGLVAAILLASGTSARQVQITGTAQGHSILEVYDDARGWVMFDPTFGVTYGSDAEPTRALSVSTAVTTKGTLVPTKVGLSTSVTPEVRQINDALFPDPWLYTRSGVRAARWPFRALFVHVGSASLLFSMGQELARGCFLLFGLITLVFGAQRLRGRKPKSPTDRAPINAERDSLLAEAPSREG